MLTNSPARNYFALVATETDLIWYAQPPTNWLRELIIRSLDDQSVFIQQITFDGAPGAAFNEYHLDTGIRLSSITNVYAATTDANGRFIRFFKYRCPDDALSYQQCELNPDHLNLPIEAVLTQTIKVGRPACRPCSTKFRHLTAS
jgi:hypothetical protein